MLQEPRWRCRSQDIAAGAMMLLRDPTFGYKSQDMAFRVQVWLVEQNFYIIALEGRVHSQFTGQALTQGVSSRELHAALHD